MRIQHLHEQGMRILSGAWVRNIPTLPDIGFKVIGQAHPDVKKMTASLLGELSDAERKDDGVIDKLQQALIEGILVQDWEGIEDDGGNPIPFSRDKLKEFLAMPALAAHLIPAINYCVGHVGVAEAEKLAADVKN